MYPFHLLVYKEADIFLTKLFFSITIRTYFNSQGYVKNYDFTRYPNADEVEEKAFTFY